jgi:regulator of protease activity HflC (stomatin/prohibitin superfamily)
LISDHSVGSQTQADSEAYSVVAAAKAEASRTKIQAEAQAEATRLAAEAEAEAIRIRAEADGKVIDQFAREMEMRRVDVSKIRAYGNKTIFASTETAAVSLSNTMALGLAASMGNDLRK